MNHAVNWEAISAIGQLVGALAVDISLARRRQRQRQNLFVSVLTLFPAEN